MTQLPLEMGNKLGPVKDHILHKTMNPEDKVSDHPGRLLNRGRFGKGNGVIMLKTTELPLDRGRPVT